MNRRSFFAKLAVAAAGFTILPPATTYDRIWRPTRKIALGRTLYRINPEWVTARYMMSFNWYGDKPLSMDSYEDNLPRFNERTPEGVLAPIYKWIAE